MKISFTKEQLMAIRAPLEPSLVLAGAGTGKTSVMAERAIWLIENENILPSEILGLTFTNKASLELKARIKNKLTKNEDFLEPKVSTYHSFALDILRDYGLSIGIDSDLQLISETSRISLAYQTLVNTNLEIKYLESSPRRIAQQIVSLDNQMSEHNLNKSTIIEYSNKLFTEIQQTKPRVDLLDLEKTLKQRIELASLVEEFRVQKLESGLIDFSDQMRFVYELVKNNTNIKDELRTNFKAVLLDEYQDTSIIQRMILVEIFGDAHPVTAVGDPLQAIYGWRGASVSNIDNFTKHFPLKNGNASKIYNLTSNFRSGLKILEHANSISKSLRDMHKAINVLVADKEDFGEVKIGLFETGAEEAKEIVKQVKELIFEKKVQYKDIVILSRNTKELLPIYDQLIKNEIPAAFSGKQDLADVPEVSEVLSYLRILEDPTHNPSLVRILSGPRFEVSPKDLALLAEQAKTLVTDFTVREKNRNFEDSLKESLTGIDVAELAVLSDALKQPGNLNYSNWAKEVFKKLHEELEFLRKFITEPLSDYLYRIMTKTGLLNEVLCSNNFMTQSRYDSLVQLQKIAQVFQESTTHAVVRQFIEFLDDADDLNTGIEFENINNENSVSLMTIHSAKGLEFPYVFITSLTKNIFPSNKGSTWMTNPSLIPFEIRQDSEVLVQNFKTTSKEFKIYENECRNLQELEERRLMYVALTRAEHQLVVTGHWWGPTQKNVQGPSIFLEELNQVLQNGHGQILNWHTEVSDENPNLNNKLSFTWPIPLDERKRLARRELANLVLNPEIVDETKLSNQEKQILSEFDNEIEILVQSLQDENLKLRKVAIPEYLNVTKSIKLIRNSKDFAENLIRPMPHKPIDQSRRGTQFHYWVEKFFAKPALFDALDIEGSADQSYIDDQTLENMKQAFTNSSWAKLEPLALEWPFEISIEGRSLRGRIDAVFKDGEDILLIDWKTGQIDKSDNLQLGWYRHAWWKSHGTDPEKLKAGFVYVPSMVFKPELNPFSVHDEVFKFKKLDLK